MPSELSAGPAQFLARISNLLADCPADGSASTVFLNEILQTFGVSAWLACKDPRSGDVSWAGSAESQGEPFPLKVAREPGGLLHSALVSGRESVVNADTIPSQTPERRFLARGRSRSWAFLPVSAMSETVACLVLTGPPGVVLEAGVLETIRMAVPVAALALQAGRLHRELDARVDQRTQEISLLYDVSRSLGFILTADDLFQLVATSLSRVIDLEMVALTVLLPDDRRFSLRLSGPAEMSAIKRVHREAMNEVARLTGESPGRIALNLTRLERPPGQPSLRAADIDLIVHVPLVIRSQVAGLLSIACREPGALGPARMRLVYTISNQASLTLDRISTAKEAEASRIHSMLESMADGVLLLDRDLRVVMSNPAAQAHLTSFMGRMPRTLTSLGEVRLRSLFEQFDRPGSRPRNFEIPPTGDGKVFSVTCSPVKALEDGVQGMAVLISDVTEARMLQLQFAQSEKLSALGEMISGVAHELNNPLASVMGYAQLLQTEPVNENVRRKVVAIDAEATRCQKVVQNLLRFARHHAPERRSVDVHAALDSVLQLLGHQLQVDDITVILDMDAALRPVMGDIHLLQQVFMNIIYNAYQAMKEKKTAGRLTLKTRNQGDLVVIEITDDGPGISPGNLKRIFDPFFSTKEVGKGTGLGLSLAYGTIREHGGAISARSTPGEGSTFVVELPAGLGIPAEAVAEIDLKPPVSTTGRRILVVEDEKPLAEVMAEILVGQGHHVDTVGDGSLAKALISRTTYDLIICDLKMPHMNGREFYRHVAGVQPDLARRIIFSTGDTASKETQAFFEEVGNAFLSKPFNLKELIRIVDKVLGAP